MSTPATRLTEDERRHFDEAGWIGPFPLLEPGQARALEPELKAAFARTRGYFYPSREDLERIYADQESCYADTPWFQSLHALSPRLLETAQRDAIADRVAELIGPDVMLWATICFAQDAGGRLHWHSDNEFHHVSGVSVWMGAANTTPENALKIMPGSHRYGRRPEDDLSTGAVTMLELQNDDRALELARTVEPEAEIVRPPVHDGEFIVFNGNLWHASDNPTDEARTAMGLRFSAPDQRVRIPMTAWEPTIWDPTPPPTVMLRGADRFGLNRRLD